MLKPRPAKKSEFKVDDDGVWQRHRPGKRRLIAPYVRKTSFLIGRGANRKWYAEFEFTNDRGERDILRLVRSESKDLETVKTSLDDLGYSWPEVKSKEEILWRFLKEGEDQKKIDWVSKTGWFESDTFVFVDTAIGPKAKKVRFRPFDIQADIEIPAGDLAVWLKTINAIVVHSSTMLLAKGTTYGAPFIERLGLESGGFNLYGPRGIGKSTGAAPALSIFSKSGKVNFDTHDISPTRLDEVRCERSGQCVYLDEAGRAGKNMKDRAEKLSDTIFRVTTGRPRQRSSGFKVDPYYPPTWNAVLSTSVQSIVKIFSAANLPMVGEEVRLIDVPAMGSKEFGVFDTLPPGYRTSQEAARALEVMCSQNYGLAGREYIKRIIADPAKAEKYVSERMAAFTKHVGGGEPRVMERFGIAYAGLKLAAKYGLIDLPKGKALDAVTTCYRRAQAGIESTPGAGAAPSDGMEIDALRASLRERTNLLDLTAPGARITGSEFAVCSGVVLKGSDGRLIYAVKPERLADLCRSTLSQRRILKDLRKRNLLKLIGGGDERDKKSTVPTTLPGLGQKRPRLVCIKARILRTPE